MRRSAKNGAKTVLQLYSSERTSTHGAAVLPEVERWTS